MNQKNIEKIKKTLLEEKGKNRKKTIANYHKK